MTSWDVSWLHVLCARSVIPFCIECDCVPWCVLFSCKKKKKVLVFFLFCFVLLCLYLKLCCTMRLTIGKVLYSWSNYKRLNYQLYPFLIFYSTIQWSQCSIWCHYWHMERRKTHKRGPALMMSIKWSLSSQQYFHLNYSSSNYWLDQGKKVVLLHHTCFCECVCTCVFLCTCIYTFRLVL